MIKLNLAGMSYEKDKVLDALQRTGATEVKLHSEAENTEIMQADCESLRIYLAETESAIEKLSEFCDAYNKNHKIKSDALKDGFGVSYTDFMSALSEREKTDNLTADIERLTSEGRELSAELSKVRRTLLSAEIYSDTNQSLKVKDTVHTAYRLGTVPASVRDGFLRDLKEIPLCAVSVRKETEESALIFLAVHKCVLSDIDEKVQSAEFADCPFDTQMSGTEFYSSLKEREEELLKKIEENGEKLYALSPEIKNMKVYADRLGYELEKAALSEKMRKTQTTFLLEAYVPKDAKELVAGQLDEVTDAIYYEFSEIPDDETPPTLLKNNKIIENFESVTNIYSPVSYREFDPNTVMAIFYSIFLGFIMADIGYGLLMFVLGGFVYLRFDGGMKRLAGVFAVGGIFAVIWGFLFGSMFGIPLEFLPFRLPDAQNDMWKLMGIKVPAVLIISMLVGMVHLFAGYMCKAYQCWRRGKVLDGIFDGAVWAVFTVGVAFALAGFVEEFNAPVLATVGGITAGASLAIAVLTAGRKEKLLGKFTKGFGSAYGVINFASDVLSYARLYGLMLSGAVIAQIISKYSVDFITGGNFMLIILGVILMVVGHVFNLAISLLGAYIHDSRLQYVEFYGRFYEGEGELFAPLGSSRKYVKLIK